METTNENQHSATWIDMTPAAFDVLKERRRQIDEGLTFIPATFRHKLVMTAALILAEIERIDRAAEREGAA